ncbi:MAG TPA: outer membrane beta-barrel protein [Bacteroidia bacterium]|nr:outer membrane beta-barrel protein [Ferruginibacter sp.]HXB11567.1 outer membrane beta-barrel protein [Bacteroidia bacterium]
MTRKKIILPFLAAIIALSANAQTDSTKTFILSGSVDAYTRTDFNNISNASNAKTSFTQTNNSFELGMASLTGTGQILSGKVFGTADLGFGPRAEVFNANNGDTTGGLMAVKQLYIGLYTGKGATGIKFTIGKWYTHIGYEVPDAVNNRNYSMDYMFTEGPFSHTGVKAEYTKGTWHFMLGAANPTNVVTIQTPFPGSATKHLLAQVDDGTKNGKWHFYLNFEGAEGMSSEIVKSTNQIDFVATGTITSKFSVGLNLTDKNYSYNSFGGVTPKTDAWGGAALYLNWDPTALFGLTLRSEYFIDNDNINGTNAKNIIDETLSGNFRVGPLTIIPEIRFESAQAQDGVLGVYSKSENMTPTNSDFSGLIAAVYKF